MTAKRFIKKFLGARASIDSAYRSRVSSARSTSIAASASADTTYLNGPPGAIASKG